MWRKIGAVTVGIAGILALFVAVAQVVQTERISGSQDLAQATQIAILSEQLHVQQEMATLQASASGSGPAATAVAQRIAELQGTAVALSTREAKGKETVTPDVNSTRIRPPTSLPARIASGTLIFEEDFEDNRIQGIGYSGDSNWKFVADEVGNNVYQIDNRDGSEFKGFSFGMDEWQDYSVEYRARLLGTTRMKSEIGLQVRSSGSTYYVLSIGEESTFLAYSIQGSEWTRLITQYPRIERDVWQKIRVDVQGEQVSVYLNDALWTNAKGPQIQRGWIMMFVGAGTHAEIDDIRVTALGE